MAIDPRIDDICQWLGAWPTRTMTLEMAPGPASMGMPSGTIPASSLAAASWVSACDSWVGERLASIMSMPMSMRMRPPAISNAGSLMPNSAKMNWPANANEINTMKHVRAAFQAIRRRRAGSTPLVMAMKEGMAAQGATRKKIELRASRENLTYVELKASSAAVVGETRAASC